MVDLSKKHIKLGKSEISFFELGLIILTAIEFLFVVYCNLCRIPDTLDNDAAKLFTHGIEIWNTKKIFIPTWVNETMLELDTAMIFALPIYGITKNLFLSYGLSNIIVLILFYCFICSILKRMGQPRYIAILNCFIITIPLSFGQLLYFNMMFFAAGFYGVKVLLAFMLIWIITTKAEDRNILYYIVLAVTTILVFVFSISSGPYSLLCAIVPVIACYLWIELGKMDTFSAVFSKWLISFNNVILYIEVIAAILGIAVSSMNNVGSKGSSMSIIKYGQFTDNCIDIIEAYLELLGSSTYTSVSLLSSEGITSLVHYVFAFVLLIAFIAVLATTLKVIFFKRDNTYEEEIYYYVFIMFIINLVVIMLIPISGSGRYLLMGLIPAITLALISIDKFLKNISSKAQAFLCYIALLGIVMMVTLTSNMKVLRNDCRPDMNSNMVKYSHVMEIISQYPDKFIYLLDDEGMAETIRAYDYKSGREYLAYMTNQQSVTVHDYYASRTDASYFEQNNIMLVDDYIADMNNLPGYIRNTYEEIGSYQNIHVYRSLVNRMDGVCGMEGLDRAIDYFYSNGYEITNGEISEEDGALRIVGNGDDVSDVISNRFSCPEASITVTLDYSGELVNGDALGILRILDGNSGEVITQAELNNNDGEVCIADADVSSTNSILIQIDISDGEEVNLKRLIYEK